MGRELQKKKNRSSFPKVKHKSKSRRLNVGDNALVASNWDQTLTLAQNYRLLGLTSKLNNRSGGIENLGSQMDAIQNPSLKPGDQLSVAFKRPTTLNPIEAQIERDPSTGVIVRVIRPPRHSNSLNDPLNDLSDDPDDEVEEEGAPLKHPSGGIAQELEEQASIEVKKRLRQQSEQEQEWIASLVRKYGGDYRRMVRDRKLNPYQQGEGDLRRRLRPPFAYHHRAELEGRVYRSLSGWWESRFIDFTAGPILDFRPLAAADAAYIQALGSVRFPTPILPSNVAGPYLFPVRLAPQH